MAIKRRTPGPRAQKIAALNDAFRKSFPSDLGRVHVTIGVTEKGLAFCEEVLALVRGFEGFDDCDPHGKNEFGEIIVDGVKVWFKIGYWDLDGEFHSNDPTDPTKTLRILTIMLPSEY